MDESKKLPFRVFLNGKYSHVAYGETIYDVLREENIRLGKKAAVTNIHIEKANSASD